MNNGGVTRAQYTALIAAYREKPGVASVAAEKVGIDRKTAKRAWERGWPDVGGGWATPIRVIIEREQESARSRAVLEAARARDATEVPQDAVERAKAAEVTVEWRKEEGKLAHGAIVNAGGLLRVVNSLLQATIPLAERVKASIASETFKAADGVRVIRDVTMLAARANETARTAVELERLHLGEPSAIIGVQDARQLTPLEAAEVIDHAAHALARAREEGRIPPAPLAIEPIDVEPGDGALPDAAPAE